jgi:hypothetical protein
MTVHTKNYILSLTGYDIIEMERQRELRENLSTNWEKVSHRRSGSFETKEQKTCSGSFSTTFSCLKDTSGNNITMFRFVAVPQ